MASSSHVVKKVTRYKLQLSATTESATVLKILQKLKNLDITLDILAETGIGKTVNSLRRHEEAGEFAKSLVKGWKSLIPKESKSHEDDKDLLESVTDKDKLDHQSSPENGCLAKTVNNNCLKSDNNNNQEVASEKEQHEGRKRKVENDDEDEKQNDDVTKKTDIQEDKTDDVTLSKRKKDSQQRSRRDSGNKNSEDQKSRSDSTEKLKSTSENGRSELERESDTKTKLSKETSKQSKDIYDKSSKPVKEIKDDESEARTKKRKKVGQEKHKSLKCKAKCENKGHSKHKKAKIKQKDGENKSDESSMSFESYLNYDVNVSKRKDQSKAKKPPKKSKSAQKEKLTKFPSKPHVTSPKQESVDLMDIPLTPALPPFKQPLSVMYSEKKVEKESDFCDASEESAVFTCQRLNRKMQVYSGAKTACLPTMMSLYQQCIRTLQNNINLLHETGGIPFEILEPVLERCTPEQLLHIEECNPIYIGVTDHLWEKHCQRDFKDSKLQEYESWKEMYIRLFEERERKFQRLTKTIILAHSKKPQGRQVKMAFIHTVAKPPRNVRIQQEIHGTAVQQPHQLKCSVKVQDNKPRPSYSKSSNTNSGGSSTQDPRKKKIAPMMAKSLKAFKKQLGHR